jgi:4-amino-4-deoxy-L-arabinose transferase-like glycosyltransferase
VIATYVTPAVILAAAVGVGLGLRRKAPLTSVLMVWTVFPLVTAALLADAPYPRYVHVTAPPLLVLAAMGCVWTADALAASFRASTRRSLAPFALPVVVGLVVLQPLLFDVRLAANPTSVTFPGLDEEQFVTGWPAGTGLRAMKRELEARAGRSGVTVVLLGPQAPGWLSYTMRNDSRFRLVPSDSDEPSALLALENGAPLPPRSDSLAWGPIHRVERPRNGVPLVLYESGVRFRGRFVASPEELRRLIVPDARFDEYVAERPAVKSWLESWYGANG